MPFDGSGNFTRARGSGTWQADATAGVKIKADLHDANDNDLASGLSNTLTKDGQSQPTANIPMNGFRLTGLGAPVNPTDAVNKAYADTDTTHLMPNKVGPADLDEFPLSNSESVPPWQRAKVTFASLKSAVMPVGVGMDFWGTTPDPGWLFAYGQAVSRTTYAKLFSKLGTTYGIGDGSTTFNLPDKRGRASFGKDDMGGTSADRMTGAYTGGINGDVLGGVGGEQAHQLSVAEMPGHAHTGATGGENVGHQHHVAGQTDVQGNHSHVIDAVNSAVSGPYNKVAGEDTQAEGADYNTSVAGAHAHNIAIWSSDRNQGHVHGIVAEGGWALHNTLPPGIVCNYIIFAGA